MAEFIFNELQTVEEGQNVLYNEDVVGCNRCITRRAGSGIVRVSGNRGNGQQRARYLVSFSGNIQIPEDGTVEEISLAIAVDGEPLLATQMIVTPAAVEEFFNVSSQTYVDVPCNCCVTVSVENTSEQAIEVQNSNLIVVRVA